MLGLMRLAALREMRGGWWLMLAAAAVITISAALTAAPLVYRPTAADLALRELIAQSPRAAQFADHARAQRPATESDWDAVYEAAALARHEFLGEFEGLVGETRAIVETPLFPGRYLRADLGYAESLPTYLMWFEGLREGARLAAGDWPTGRATQSGAIPVLAGTALAEEVGLEVGTILNEDSLALEVVGLVEPIPNPSRSLALHYTDVWFELQIDIGIGGAQEPYMGLFVSREALLDSVANTWPGLPLTHRLRTELHPDALVSDQVEDTIEALAGYGQFLSRLEGGSSGISLENVLRDFERRAQFSAGQSLLAGLQVAAAGLFAVALVGRLTAARTRSDRERLAARGAKAWQQAAAQALLGLWIAAPAAALGAPLAAFALHHAGRLGALARVSGGEPLDTRLTWEAWLLAVGGAVLAWAAFAAPAWFEARRSSAGDRRGVLGGRPARQSLIQRAWLDVALLVLAGVLFMQFESEASGGALAAFETGGMNPVLMLSPGLLLLGAALALMRVGPRVWGSLGALLSRTGAPSWLLLGVQTTARNPGGSMLLTALVAFVTAVGLISATYASTIREMETERVRYTVGADLRGVSIGSNLGNSTAGRVTEPLDSRADVSGAAAAFRGIGSIGGDKAGSRVILLGVQTDRLSEISELRPELLGLPPAQLLEAIAREPGRPGVPLPEGTEGLSLWARTDPANSNLELHLRVLDRYGQAHERRLAQSTGSTLSGEWQQLRASVQTLTEPLRLAALIARPQARVVRAPTGVLWIDDLRVDTGDGSVVIEGFEPGAPWLTASGGAGADRIEFSANAARAGETGLAYHWTSLGANDERLIVRASPNVPVAAAIDRESYDASGLALGDVTAISLANFSVPVSIVAVVDYFPTLNPAQGGFVIADLLALRSASVVSSQQAVLPITEVWAGVSSDGGRAAVGSLLDEVYLSSTVFDAVGLTTAAQEDPFRSGGVSALFLVGFLGLLIVGAAALVLTLASSAAERAREFALLRTIGVARAELALQAAVEVGLVLIAGVGIGLGLGWAVTGALLAFLDVTVEGVAAAPPTVLSVDWLVAGLGVAVITVCGLAGTALVSRWASRRDAAALLREGSE